MVNMNKGSIVGYEGEMCADTSGFALPSERVERRSQDEIAVSSIECGPLWEMVKGRFGSLAW